MIKNGIRPADAKVEIVYLDFGSGGHEYDLSNSRLIAGFAGLVS